MKIKMVLYLQENSPTNTMSSKGLILTTVSSNYQGASFLIFLLKQPQDLKNCELVTGLFYMDLFQDFFLHLRKVLPYFWLNLNTSAPFLSFYLK